MKREVIGRVMIVAATAMFCLAGCGADKNISEETVVGIEDLAEKVNVKETDISENSVVQTDYDVQKVLEDAEREAAALQKKLQEDPTLTQADMNTLSMEIYQVWDAVLNDLWEILKASLDEASMDNLLQEQRTWIIEKEAKVKSAGEEFAGGSMAPLTANQKATELTQTRVYELAYYLGYERDLE